MEQYIKKSDLVARIKKLKMDIGNIFNDYDEGFWEGRSTAFDDVICALDTLEVKNVNLEEEVDKKLEECNWEFDQIDFYKFAQYFYELGLKQKENKA